MRLELVPRHCGASAIRIGEDGFDLLGRKDAAHGLTALVDGVPGPLVIALDGGWGTGKSWFLKLWPGEHTRCGGTARLIYFDAFAHDYLDDPLVSLALRLEECLGEGETPASTALDRFRAAARKLAFPAARILAAVATTGASAAIAAGIGAAAQEAEPLAERFWQAEKGRIAAIGEVRAALAELAQDAPIVLIVDELDRCRPDHALAMLEVIKHFFDAPRVHFVLGANMAALRLQKFVNLTMTLPEPKRGVSALVYLEHRIDLLQAEGHGAARHPKLLREVANVAAFPALRDGLSLRAVERLLDRIALLPKDAGQRNEFEASLVAFALLLEVVDRPLMLEFLAGRADRARILAFSHEASRNAPGEQSRDSLVLTDLSTMVLGDEPSLTAKRSLDNLYFLDVVPSTYGAHFRKVLTDTLGLFRLPAGPA
jgi:hypothetical protein